MADRHLSKDGVRKTDAYTQGKTPAQQGRAGGVMARKVGTRDLLKQVREGEGETTTRVRKSDKTEAADG